jgi:ACS family D-galactonate transporter-like MFS transporter
MPKRQWTIVLLLVSSAVINYIDRGSMSVAAPSLSAEWSLTPVQMGLVLSAFFWSYTAFQTLSGWLMDRFPVLWVYGLGFLVWSAATLGTGFARTLAILIALRVVLGAGESVAMPAYSKVIAGAFPIDRRGVPNALIEAGTKLGPALGNLIGGMLVARHGWRLLFLALGSASLVWLVPWSLWGPRQTGAAKAIHAAGPSLTEILACRDAWGTFLGSSCYTYGFFFLLTWLPSYLVKARHVSLEQMAILGSLPFWGAAVTATLCGWLSDTWIRQGGSPTRVRKTFVATGLLLSSMMAPAAVVSDLKMSVGLLIGAYGAFGMFASNHWAISQTLAGPEAAGKWSGLQNTLSSAMGIVAPIATGFIVQETGSYYWAFVSPAILAVAGAACYLFLVGPVAPIQWRGEA